ncbi:diguanylate cyclase [Thalassomonas viridans]|uniref:diguanylate cyclase n=1 Tax=Thalassomonas viridans TaxID=137584 RepID=A0AAE9YYN1_9GAMM|nr:diguanylate cyclase [Thalassomonas viridans]WDE03626.1 diguanylate cyclase [Thalassomonas viridans]
MSKARILIVDDERLNINVMVSILSEDYELVIAKSGEQALKRVAAQAPDLILLDISMPDMDGYTVFERIGEMTGGKKIPIIFITAMRSPEEEIKGLKMGAVDYITKPFTPSIVEVRVANQIEAKRNRDELERLNRTDALTGIANRRRFDEYIMLQRESIVRSEAALSIIMIDIDHFKQFNDCYGHAAGDDCLKRVAKALESRLDRTTDFIARYGGEEFVVILPATDSQGAAQCAERLCEAVSELDILHDQSGTCGHVTASFGVATLLPEQREVSVEDLLEWADQALYQAKLSGRNQYRVAGQG